MKRIRFILEKQESKRIKPSDQATILSLKENLRQLEKNLLKLEEKITEKTLMQVTKVNTNQIEGFISEEEKQELIEALIVETEQEAAKEEIDNWQGIEHISDHLASNSISILEWEKLDLKADASESSTIDDTTSESSFLGDMDNLLDFS